MEQGYINYLSIIEWPNPEHFLRGEPARGEDPGTRNSTKRKVQRQADAGVDENEKDDSR